MNSGKGMDVPFKPRGMAVDPAEEKSESKAERMREAKMGEPKAEKAEAKKSGGKKLCPICNRSVSCPHM